MVQNIIRALALLGLFGLGYDHISDDSREVIQPVQTTIAEVVIAEPEPVVIVPPKPDCECLRDFMVSTIGVKEKTGNNDGFWVEKYLSNVKMSKGNPWCAAYVRYGLDSCGIKSTITAWSPTAVNKSNTVWKQGWKKESQVGDVFTLYYVKLGRVGHTGYVESAVNSVTVETIEGNTNQQGSRNGNGVFRRKRALNSLHGIWRWENR